MGSCIGTGNNNKGQPIKILVLGSAGSGKSTLLKQMMFLHTGNYGNDTYDYRDIAHTNLLLGMQDLLRCLKNLDIPVQPENKKNERFFLEMNEIPMDIGDNFYEKIKALWADPAIQQIWLKRSTLALHIKHYDYLVENLDRYHSPNYEPSAQDMLLLRQRTTGVVRIRFLSDKIDWEFIDVGGQKSERTKWEDLLTAEDIRGIFFLSSLDDYSAPSIEDHSINSFELSKNIFKELIESEFAAQIPKVVFFNKLDLLTQHVTTDEGWEHFRETYPSFTPNSDKSRGQAASQFLAKQFAQLAPKNTDFHIGSCLNVDFVSMIYSDLKKMVANEALAMAGLQPKVS